MSVRSGPSGLGLIVAGAASGAAGTLLACHRELCRRARGQVVTDPALAAGRLAIVLGAGLRPDGTPTGVLARRVDAAIELYRLGHSPRLVMSGAAEGHLDQPLAMARYALDRGVDAGHVDLDRSGVDTGHTCRTAALIHPGKPVVLVTQQFHARRTAYLASKAGLDALVLATADSEIRATALAKARTREVPAAIKAVLFD